MNRKNVLLHSSQRYVATPPFIEHPAYNAYGKGVNDKVNIIQTSNFLNGHVTEK